MAGRGNDEWFGTWNWPPDGSDGKIIPAPKVKKATDKDWSAFFKNLKFSGKYVIRSYKPPDFSKYVQEIKDSYTKRGLELPRAGDGWGKIKYRTRRGPWSNRGEGPESEDILLQKIKVIEAALPESLQGRIDYSEFTTERNKYFEKVKQMEEPREIRPRKKTTKAFVEAMKQKKLLESRPKKEKFVPKQISLRPVASQQAETPSDVSSFVVLHDELTDLSLTDLSLYGLEDLKSSCLTCEKVEDLDEDDVLNEDDVAFSNFISIVEGIFRKFIRFTSALMLKDIECLEDSDSNILDLDSERVKIRSKRLLITLIGDAAYPQTDEGLAKFWYHVETMEEMEITDIKYLAEQVRNML